MIKKISLLGATGSIGTQTVDVISGHPEQFQLVAMSFGRNISVALNMIHQLKPELVCVQTKGIQEKIRYEIPSSIKVVYGKEGLIETAVYEKSDFLVNAVLGRVGLEPTLAAIDAGKTIALANKETLVTAGHLITEAARKNQVPILPIDSEHSAIFQCLRKENRKDVSRLVLTASGGSFRNKSREELRNVTVKEALNHPNWSMGAKLTVDSATMMNKGLEVIEAHWLFDMDYDQIDVVLHKESIVHSLVEFMDTTVLAQLGEPDMRVPIQYALSYPERLELKQAKRLNLWKTAALHFKEMDMNRFRALAFAFEAGRTGGTAPTVLNAANEKAVQLFLEGRLSFLAIEDRIDAALSRHTPISYPDLEEIQAIDEETRQFVGSNG